MTDENDQLIKKRDELLDLISTRYYRQEGYAFSWVVWKEIQELNRSIEHTVAYVPMTPIERELKECGRSSFNQMYFYYFGIEEQSQFYFKRKK